MMAFQMSWVVGIFIGLPDGIRLHIRSQAFKKALPLLGSFVAAWSVFLAGKLRKAALGGHASDLKLQDFSRLGIDCKCDAQGLTFRVLARLQIIKLDLRKGLTQIVFGQKILVPQLLFQRQKPNPPNNRPA